MASMEFILFTTYSMKHQRMEGQSKCQQQEDEKDQDTQECLYNFSKHYNINTKALKPVKKQETHF